MGGRWGGTLNYMYLLKENKKMTFKTWNPLKIFKKQKKKFEKKVKFEFNLLILK